MLICKESHFLLDAKGLKVEKLRRFEIHSTLFCKILLTQGLARGSLLDSTLKCK